jgi:hypothetical protein
MQFPNPFHNASIGATKKLISYCKLSLSIWGFISTIIIQFILLEAVAKLTGMHDVYLGGYLSISPWIIPALRLFLIDECVIVYGGGVSALQQLLRALPTYRCARGRAAERVCMLSLRIPGESH